MIKKNNSMLVLAIAGAFMLSVTSCGDAKTEAPVKTETPKAEEVKKGPTITEVAAENANFSTLVSALKAADLVKVLNGDGPYTVFAPTNDAFAALPEGTLDELLLPENKKKLVGILTYHVLPGKIDAATLIKTINETDGTYEVVTGQGGKIAASIEEGNVILTDGNGNSSKVVMTDVECSNGMIHGIDAVAMPAE